MKQPDRWDRIVDKEKWGNELDGYFFRPAHVAKLLRAQHRAYVRMVKKELLEWSKYVLENKDKPALVTRGHDRARQCMELVEKLKDYAR